MKTYLGARRWGQEGGDRRCGCLDAAAVRAAILKRAARLHCIPHLRLAGFGWWVSVPIDQIRARSARTFCLLAAAWWAAPRSYVASDMPRKVFMKKWRLWRHGSQ